MLLEHILEIYDLKTVVAELSAVGEQHWSPAIVKRVVTLARANTRLSENECAHLASLLPRPSKHHPNYAFRFVDLFAGIGGIRHGFEAIGGQCVFTSEWNKHAVRTYKANWYCDPVEHRFNTDIRDVTLSNQPDVSDREAQENVKNLKSHDGGKTFRIIMQTLDELGYEVSDAADMGANDPKIIDGQHFLPQHRERIVLVGFRRDLGLHEGFTLRDIPSLYPVQLPTFGELLEPNVNPKFILTPVLWKYLYRYARKHQEKGNGFGYGLVDPTKASSVARTLSARYYKDGAEILIDRGWDLALGEKHFDDPQNQLHRPRRLTPRECARLMGFESPQGYRFRIPVSDTQAYRQFGNSVIVPVFAAVARLLQSRILQAVALRDSETGDGGRSR